MKTFFLTGLIFLSSSAFSKNCKAQFKNKILTYEQARQKVRKLGVQSSSEYFNIDKEEREKLNLPSDPKKYYSAKKLWKGWKDFLKTNFLPYEDTRAVLKKLQIKSEKQYQAIKPQQKKQLGLPANPQDFYEKTRQWEGWSEFLGIKFHSYEQAKIVTQSLKLESINDYLMMALDVRQNLKLPSNPIEYYKKDWKSWKEYLGSSYQSNKRRSFLSYEEARKKVQELGVWSSREFAKNRPVNIHSLPYVYYKKDWKGWKNFFGTKILTYEQAKEKVRELGIKNLAQYQTMDPKEKKQLGLPVSLKYYYTKKGEWIDSEDFFNVKKIKILTYEQAKEKVRELGVRSFKEYRAIDPKKKMELNLPKTPNHYYKKQGKWVNWYDFLGKNQNTLLKNKSEGVEI